VPRITAADSHTFTGTVASTGVIGLNFASDGRVGQVLVRSGQQVKPGQVLAVENSSPPMAALNADRAAIAADLAGEGELRAASGPAGGPAAIAAATARLAKDQAQLASDQAHLAGAEIVAPAGGTVVAVNGQAGETVSASGIRTYPPQFSLPSAQPAFSLLPEGPRPSVAGRAAAPAMPVVALRITSDWLVDMLVPQTAVAAIRPGQRVIVAVPAVRLSRVKGHVEAVSPAPVATSSGIAYQVSVSVTGRRRAVPFSGMTANVQIVP
jgi:multidrug resistance efflux pump